MSTPAEPAASTTLHGAPHAGGLPVRAAPLPGATAIELCTRDVVTADSAPASPTPPRDLDHHQGGHT